MSEASDTAKRVLTQEAFAYFCTTDIRNVPHVVPVFFVFDPIICHAYFLFSGEPKKVRNIRSHAKVSFTVDVRDPVNPLENKGVMVQGEARAERATGIDTRTEQVKPLFEEKYGWSSSQIFFRHDHAERLLVDVAVMKITCWRGPRFVSCPEFCIAPNR
jgi:nitroimidazol reductase NimA-like FMN-containing flavoprotein (pyridoxamine 5'-phosphate oxidase superfamily)